MNFHPKSAKSTHRASTFMFTKPLETREPTSTLGEFEVTVDVEVDKIRRVFVSN